MPDEKKQLGELCGLNWAAFAGMRGLILIPFMSSAFNSGARSVGGVGGGAGGSLNWLWGTLEGIYVHLSLQTWSRRLLFAMATLVSCVPSFSFVPAPIG